MREQLADFRDSVMTAHFAAGPQSSDPLDGG
jgi:hypothetical protein